MRRWVARVRSLRGAPEDYLSLAVSLTGKIGTRTPMPVLTWIIIEHNDDGVFVLSYADSLMFAGDSWFQSLDAAFDYAEDEYGVREGDWIEVPDGVSEPLEFALSRLGSKTIEDGGAP